MNKFCPQCGQIKPIEEFYTESKDKTKYRKYCKECWKKKTLAYERNHPEVRRVYKIKANFNVTSDYIQELLEEQESLCAICNKEFEPSGRKGPHIDHAHKTGYIRGLLCGSCNRGLGLFYDSPDLMRRAAEYVETNGFS